MEKELIEAADCIAQHINSFINQTRKGQEADFGQPCADCMYRGECKFDWLSKMQPVLKYSNVKVKLVRTEH